MTVTTGTTGRTGTAGTPGAAPGAAFVQLGAARDGLDPYLRCARDREMRTVLVETPAYLRWRRLLGGRRPFDIELPVHRPEDPARVAAALRRARIRPALLLAGFDRYVTSAFALAAELRTAPWPESGQDFTPPDKTGQRAALTRLAPEVLQARHAYLPVPLPPPEVVGRALAGLAFPQVVKPVDGAGGLGVFLVRNPAERDRALRGTAATANYGGAPFTGLMVEELVRGTEFSLQGVAWDGRARLLSFCEKVVLPETAAEPGPPGGSQHGGSPPGEALCGFREAGHLAASAALAPPELRRLAQSCVTATGYRRGPFHIDAIHGQQGPYFLEMGFRLSGAGLAGLVQRATGLCWAELAFAAHLDGREPQSAPPSGARAAVGQLVATEPHQLERARALAATEPGVRLELSTAPPVPGDLPYGDAGPLSSDRRRHAVVRGRVLLESARRERIRDWLHQCATEGAPVLQPD